MKKAFSLIAIVVVLAISSCTKEKTAAPGKISNVHDIVVPAGFTWENSRDVYFDINIADSKFGSSFYTVSIYDADPALGGKVLSTGAASTTTHFLTKVYLANTLKEVYVMKTAPDNTSTTQKVSVSGTNVALSMAAGTSSGTVYKIKGINDGPDCTTGCSTTVTTTSNITVNSGQTVCITGSNITVNVTNYGGVVRVCGTNVTIPTITIDNNGSLIVTKTGTVTIGSISLYNANTSFTNYGTVAINGNLAYNATTLNEGTMSMTGDLNIYAGSSFTNNGAVTIGGSLTNSTSTPVTNNGSIIVNSSVNNNSTSTIINNCSVWTKQSYFNNGITKNSGLIKVNNDVQVYASSEMGLYNGGMLKAASIVVAGAIRGYGTTSLVKISGNSTMYVGSVLNGPFQYCDANGIENNQSSFTGGAAASCGQYIPITNCNSEGNGTAPVTDTDGDGVVDTQDEYPTDATKAFNNYYPSSAPSERATIGFEDQWPIRGDYDLNDVVVSYRYKIVTNATNKVVQVVGDYTLNASGTGYNNGFGVEFPILRSAVSGVTGGTLEAGQTNAVVVLFTDVRQEQALWNTRSTDHPITTPKNYSITFNVSGGPALGIFGLSTYNPFIWNGKQGYGGRAFEIHLPGKTPTSLANLAVFGTGDDNSNVSAARYYVTTTGLPWAINMPITTFSYPTEATEITAAYLKFQAWAESGGAQFTDWYSGTISGYRDASKLFVP